MPIKKGCTVYFGNGESNPQTVAVSSIAGIGSFTKIKVVLKDVFFQTFSANDYLRVSTTATVNNQVLVNGGSSSVLFTIPKKDNEEPRFFVSKENKEVVITTSTTFTISIIDVSGTVIPADEISGKLEFEMIIF